MSNVAMKERVMIGALASFLEAGTTVDGKIVAAETVVSPAAGLPDNVPTDNWPDLGAIESAKFMPKVSTETVLEPSAAGGYDELEVVNVTADELELKTNHMSEPAYRMLFGMASVIVPGTPQEAHANRDRKVTGWLRVSMTTGGGDERVLMHWWCELRLKDQPEITNKLLRPTFKVRKLKSSLNSADFPV